MTARIGYVFESNDLSWESCDDFFRRYKVLRSNIGSYNGGVGRFQNVPSLGIEQGTFDRS
jgi:hypothetical protein